MPADQTLQRLTNIPVCSEDRWQIYHRLQELEIGCQCSGFQPLTVDIKTATEAIQLWSVAKRVSQSRQDLAWALTQSWRLPSHRVNTQR